MDLLKWKLRTICLIFDRRACPGILFHSPNKHLEVHLLLTSSGGYALSRNFSRNAINIWYWGREDVSCVWNESAGLVGKKEDEICATSPVHLALLYRRGPVHQSNDDSTYLLWASLLYPPCRQMIISSNAYGRQSTIEYTSATNICLHLPIPYIPLTMLFPSLSYLSKEHHKMYNLVYRGSNHRWRNPTKTFSLRHP